MYVLQNPTGCQHKHMTKCAISIWEDQWAVFVLYKLRQEVSLYAVRPSIMPFTACTPYEHRGGKKQWYRCHMGSGAYLIPTCSSGAAPSEKCLATTLGTVIHCNTAISWKFVNARVWEWEMGSPSELLRKLAKLSLGPGWTHVPAFWGTKGTLQESSKPWH